MNQYTSQEPLVVPAAEGQAYPPYQGQPADPEKQMPPPEGAYPPQQQGYPQQQAYPPLGYPQEGYPQQPPAYPQQQPPAYPQQQPPVYPQQQGYSQPPPPGYQGYPQGYAPQTATTTAVIVTQPTTTYVQPSLRRNNESIPTIGLVLTIIHLIICLSFGNILIVACLVPALICAIVGLGNTENEQSAKTFGYLAIGTNVATLIFYVVGFIVLIAVLVNL